MGEYADMAIADALAAYDYDDNEMWVWGESYQTARRYKRRPRPITCKFCGKPHMIWRKQDGYWKLFEPRRRNGAWIAHSCLESQAGRFPPSES